eukprot:SAG22_NODE_29_length_28404_cov_23.294153_14_plen_125_part_00
MCTAPARSFAAAPTVKLHGISGRYATSLYMVAAKSNSLAAVEAELATITRNRDESAEFKAFFEDPSLNAVQCAAGLDAALTKGGYSDTTKNFFCECSWRRLRARTVQRAHTTLLSLSRSSPWRT